LQKSLEKRLHSMQDHWQVDPLSVARSCAHAVAAKGGDGHYLRSPAA
jgi:hypothetical protein